MSLTLEVAEVKKIYNKLKEPTERMFGWEGGDNLAKNLYISLMRNYFSDDDTSDHERYSEYSQKLMNLIEIIKAEGNRDVQEADTFDIFMAYILTQNLESGVPEDEKDLMDLFNFLKQKGIKPKIGWTPSKGETFELFNKKKLKSNLKEMESYKGDVSVIWKLENYHGEILKTLILSTIRAYYDPYFSGEGSDDSILLEFSEKLLQILEMIKETEGDPLKKEETFNLFAAYITYYDIYKNDEPLDEDSSLENVANWINIVGNKYKSKLNPKAKESGGKRNKRRTQKRNGNKRRNNNSRKQKRNVSKKNNKSRKQNRR